jgi:hypothetical protein
MSKKALLIGILYTDGPIESRLNGCLNDALAMRNLLISYFGYSSEDITILSDGERKYLKPTRRNILRALAKIVLSSRRSVDELFLFYSGHGYHIKDRSRDEEDGEDECIIPCDYQRRGVIKDDLFRKYFRYVPRSKKVTAIFDCCHSGTMLDLKYKYGSNPNPKIRRPLRCQLLSISGCRDDQQSVDIRNLSGRGKWGGALTQAIEKFVKETDAGKDIPVDLFLTLVNDMFLRNNIDQRPVVCASYPLDQRSKIVNKIACKACGRDGFAWGG